MGGDDEEVTGVMHPSLQPFPVSCQISASSNDLIGMTIGHMDLLLPLDPLPAGRIITGGTAEVAAPCHGREGHAIQDTPEDPMAAIGAMIPVAPATTTAAAVAP